MKQQHISGGTMCSTLENFFKIAVFAVGIFIIWGWGNSLEVRADSDEKNLKNCLAGTYLIEEGSGTRGLWEFSKDGNFTGTSSAQPLLNFSTLQGMWKPNGKRTAKAIVLDFSFDDQENLINIARVDILVRGEGKKCQKVEGEFSLRFFEEGEDPLQVETDAGEPFMDLFTGQRITAN